MDILERAYGTQQAMSLMERVSKSLKTKAFDFLRKVDYKNLLMILQNEHPQTIAMVLSYCRSRLPRSSSSCRRRSRWTWWSGLPSWTGLPRRL